MDTERWINLGSLIVVTLSQLFNRVTNRRTKSVEDSLEKAKERSSEVANRIQKQYLEAKEERAELDKRLALLEEWRRGVDEWRRMSDKRHEDRAQQEWQDRRRTPR